jgi:hypothetical protein
MAGTVKMKEACSLNHQANLGEEVDEVPFEAGEELTVLQEWENSYLVKNSDGKLFNVGKNLVETADS